ncbi:MAG: bifunctional pyr operon transcriptional regulator/uracil phosphoribosyltransferase PyrR [Jatrophihabitantaceae bacterium]
MTGRARVPEATSQTAPPSPSSGAASTILFGPADVGRVLDRMAHQIIENTAKSGFDIVLLGIPTRGVPLARRLADRIATFAAVDIPVGSLDITLYRDDLRLRGVRPLGETIEPKGGISGRTVVLVDDVLFSGRSIRSAFDALKDLGRPRSVQLAVLVDRGHRELPIRADYVGKNVPTAPTQNVRVCLTETDGADSVSVTEAGVQ